MKKKVLLSVLAAGLVLPTASALAQQPNFTQPTSAVNPTIDQLGREYGWRAADVAAAQIAAKTTAQDLVTAETKLDNVTAAENAKVAAAQGKVAAAQLAWDNATTNALKGVDANDKAAVEAAVAAIDPALVSALEGAKTDLEVVKATAAKNIKAAEVQVAAAKKANDSANAQLAAAQKALQAVIDKLYGAGATKEQVEKIKAGAPATTATTAAKAGAAKKALPKTSAVK